VPGGFSETSIVVHETTEAYAGTLNGSNFQASHQVGLDFENQQRLQEGLPARIGESATPLWQGARVEINFSFSKESFDYDRLSGNISNVSVQHTNGPDGQLPKEKE
jgi:hypothetical protein